MSVRYVLPLGDGLTVVTVRNRHGRDADRVPGREYQIGTVGGGRGALGPDAVARLSRALSFHPKVAGAWLYADRLQSTMAGWTL
ncbi:hypothetical protein ABT234_14110 [Streptomyces sp. NPDC001586]|uniref:hypothetical protein n=1 Tax=Streptomyces sp. NPDC001586 TaxID=3154387 RepID=UPI003320BB42